MNWLIIGITAAVVSFIGYGLHSWDIDRLEAKHVKELNAQIEFDKQQCKAGKQITERTSSDFQKDIISDADKLAYYDSLPVIPAPVIVQPSSKTTGCVPATSRGEYDRPGSKTAWLNYAATAEHYRSQLKACQLFVDDVYKLNNQ